MNFWQKLARKIKVEYYAKKHRSAFHYQDPNEDELKQIEADLVRLGVKTMDYNPNPEKFSSFCADDWFPHDYHGGRFGGVWDEKLLEHWIVAEKCNFLNSQKTISYLDVAANNSPWAKLLREKKHINAFAIDMDAVGEIYEQLPYYTVQNATDTSFPNNFFDVISLQCAFEMFRDNDDQNLLPEIARILKPGGRAIILPLYMHTHYCAYATADYFGKGYADDQAVEYLSPKGFGIPSSRKYDARKLKERVLDVIEGLGMKYKISILRNKNDMGTGIYCHFILEIQKP